MKKPNSGSKDGYKMKDKAEDEAMEYIDISYPNNVPTGNYCLCGNKSEDVYCPIHGWTRTIRHPHRLIGGSVANFVVPLK